MEDKDNFFVGVFTGVLVLAIITVCAAIAQAVGYINLFIFVALLYALFKIHEANRNLGDIHDDLISIHNLMAEFWDEEDEEELEETKL